MAVLEVSSETFEAEVLKSNLPVLVDFWAPWCGPCRMMNPIIDDLAKKYDGKVKVVKANVDEVADVAGKYGIRAIPTMMMFKGGEPGAQPTIVGAVPENQLSDALNKLIA